jgi:hypothetical protein
MRTREPYFTRARFNSTCPETGLVIAIGQRIAYFPAVRKAYHENSTHADQLRALEFSRAFNMADANY